MNRPLVTIGIPTFNRSAYLAEAVQSAVNQSYRNLEIIISDNGSTDDTAAFLSKQKDERIVVIRHQENRGMVYNWNACLSRATGKYFLLLSDDDVLESNAVTVLMSKFCLGGVSLSYGQVRHFSDSGNDFRAERFIAPGIES